MASDDWQLTKKTVLERNSHMFNNPLMSDVMFTCGDSGKVSFYAHRYVLATSSPVFYAMFYGDLAEKVSTIHLEDTDASSFREFLRFLYTDKSTLTLETAIPVLYLAKKYLISPLAEKCIEVVRDNISAENAFEILENILLFDDTNIEKKCWEVVDLRTRQALTSESFNDINNKTLISLLKRKTLNIEEIELFEALLAWSNHQCSKNGLEATIENKRAILGDAVYQISFFSMTQTEFLQRVSLSGLLTGEEIDLVFDKFNRHDSPTLAWKRQVHLSHLEYYPRYSCASVRPPSSAWEYTGKPDCLSFSVSRSALFHGVRLFGDANESEYHVSLEVNGDLVRTGIYCSKLKDKGTYGFDVTLPKPLAIERDELVTMAATVTGPNSYYGMNGNALVEINGVTVTFRNAPGSLNGTDVTQGQFQQLILSF